MLWPVVALPAAFAIGAWGGARIATVMRIPPAGLVGTRSPMISLHAVRYLARRVGDLKVGGRESVATVLYFRERVLPIESALQARGVPPAYARALAWTILREASVAGVDPRLVLAVAIRESRLDSLATSPAGARGLMQVMPMWDGTWKHCGRGLYGLRANVCVGSRLLALNLRKAATTDEALLRYNGCAGAAARESDCERYGGEVRALADSLTRTLAVWRDPRP